MAIDMQMRDAANGRALVDKMPAAVRQLIEIMLLTINNSRHIATL